MRNLPEIPIQRFGAVVSAQLGISEARRAALRAEGQLAPIEQHVTMLIDTGATCSFIRPAYVRLLGLSQDGWHDFETTRGFSDREPSYIVSLAIGVIGAINAKRFETAVGVQKFEQTPHDGLLGRDILQHLHLAWNGPGQNVRISYL